MKQNNASANNTSANNASANNTSTRKGQATEAWGAELGRVLSEASDSLPLVRRASLGENDLAAEMLWWRASGGPETFIGVPAAEAPFLPLSFSDLLSKSWGPGEVTDQGPENAGEWESWEAKFADGANVRFFVALGTAAPAQESPNLDMLMDIELPLMIRFGHRQMTLREIARLTPGSVIGFERSADEPVELMINGHVVALGEAVSVRGSYGIRISEISSRRERLVTSSLAAREQTI
jgi:flagellar motor switch protein FliN/FliY